MTDDNKKNAELRSAEWLVKGFVERATGEKIEVGDVLGVWLPKVARALYVLEKGDSKTLKEAHATKWERVVRVAIAEATEKHPKVNFAALIEEVGEVAKALQDGNREDYAYELTQVAAVCFRLLAESEKQYPPDLGPDDTKGLTWQEDH
jgi:hypothetical protein